MPATLVLSSDVLDADAALHQQVVGGAIELVRLRRPSPTDSAPCGSKSTSSTRRPSSASAAPRLIVEVVLPTPPFWLHSAMMRAGRAGPAASVGDHPLAPGDGGIGRLRRLDAEQLARTRRCVVGLVDMAMKRWRRASVLAGRDVTVGRRR